MIAETAVSRTRICLECRTALGEHEPCDGGRNHRVASLRAADGREALVREVWGSPSVRRRARELARAGGAGAASGSALELCSGADACDCVSFGGEGIGVVLAILLVAGVVMLVYFIVVKTIEWRRRKRHALRPHGALLRPRAHGALLRGTVVGPAGAPERIGFGLALRHRGALREGVMLRDGASLGFEVMLEDGERAHVPAGRIRLEGARAAERGLDRALLDRYLATLDPLRPPELVEKEPYEDPLPFTRAVLFELRAGDRVELQGDFERRAPVDAPVAYREAPPSVWVARGVVSVQLVPG
jgi:hypothetical protein